jgi:hypothetical protein
MRIAYFDCFSGVSGDMLIGAMLDAGVELRALEEMLRPLGLGGFRMAARKTKRCGLSATKFDVIETGPQGEKGARASAPRVGHEECHASRFGGNPRKMLAFVKKSDLAGAVKSAAVRVLQRIVAAEAAVHGCRPRNVRLHELACIDTVVDIVGAVCCLRILGVERFHVSPLPVGSGSVTCSHGVLPIPAPATIEMLKGLPIAPLDAEYELATPTGAAFVSTLAAGFGACPEMTVESVGYGAGAVDPPGRPNVLRVIVGEAASAGETDTVLVFETNVDNMTGEEIGYAFECFFKSGALDVYAIPLVMKKSRPGVMLGVIAPVALREAIEEVFFRETRTLGVRCSVMSRSKALRRTRIAATPYGHMRVKDSRWHDATLRISAEYEDCRTAAQGHDVSLRTTRNAVEQAVSGRHRRQ